MEPKATLETDEGLICSFELGGGSARWQHFNLNDTRARRWIEQQPEIAPQARELLLDPESRIQAQNVQGALVLILADLHHELRGDPELTGSMAIYLDAHLIVTGRRHPLKSPDRLRRKVLQEGAPASTVVLLEDLVEILVDSYSDLVTRLSDDIDDAEDKILAGLLHDQGSKLGRMRRLLARLRRYTRANRAALVAALPRLPAVFEDQDRRRLHEMLERMDTMGQDIDLAQERTRLMQEEIAGRLNEATNRNLFFLSVTTATLLPVTLITGIWGMNVGGLPWLNHPGGFWRVTAIMLIAVVAILTLLRRRRIF